MSSVFAVGHLVEFQGGAGIGRVSAVADDLLHVDFFESMAEPKIETQAIPGSPADAYG
ncbi:hypothetical protein N7U49_22525 [Streptomyces sp. AD2-2]|nr:hypothetical protein N7U49_22525 [Streptomyces sp. AD2-2]